jgi:hypothetical protein
MPLKSYFALQYKKTRAPKGMEAISHKQSLSQEVAYQELWSKHIFSLNDRSKAPNIESWSKSIDEQFLLQKLQVMAAAKSYQAFVKVNFNIHLQEEVLQEASHDDRPTLIKAYLLTHKLQNNAEALEDFFALKKLIQNHLSDIAVNEAREICTLARNFCIRRINKADGQFYREIFQIYQLELKHHILLEQGELSPASYKNIVSTALYLDEYKWLESFINEYTPHLPKDHREPQYIFNLARLRFKQQQFQEVISLLSKVEYTDLLLTNSIKAMLCKAYYELDEYNALDSLLDSFRIFIRRKGTMAYHQKVYLNFIKFLRKIMNMNPSDKAGKEKLQAELLATKDIIDQDWLMDKLR